MMRRSHDIEIAGGLKALEALRQEWDEVAPPGRTEPWQSFDWIEACAIAYAESHPLRVMTVRSEGRLTAIAPMVLKPSGQALRPMRMDFLGGEELKEPNNFVSMDPESLDLLMDAIAAEPVYPVRLSRIPADREAASRIVTRFRKDGWITRVMSMPYPYLNLEAAPAKKSLAEDLRRARRKAERRGRVRMELAVVESDQELRQYLEQGFQIEASGWKGLTRTAILSSESRRQFFEYYAHSALDRGLLRLFFLYIDDVPVAVQYGVQSANAYWLLKIGYDESYRECSPGNILLDYTVNTLKKMGVKRYNFLGKEEPWIQRWTADLQDCLVLAAYRPNPQGVRAALSDALYLGEKKWRHWKTKRIKEKGRPVADAIGSAVAGGNSCNPSTASP